MARAIRRTKATCNARPEENKQRLVDMPVDLLIEVFQYLEPLDLLYLARITKGFREFILNRNKCSPLWKIAISNVDGLPPCPEYYMSAPAYTHLAFVPVCHGCFGPCETVEWDLRMRCCPKCIDKMMTKLPCEGPNGKYLRELGLPKSSTNRYKLNTRRWDCCLRVTVITDSTDLINFVSRLDLDEAMSCRRPKKMTREEFLSEKREFWSSIRTHAYACECWQSKRLKAQATQLSLARRQRVDTIKHKFIELGWKKSDVSKLCNHDFNSLPQVSGIKPLTPTEWSEIGPGLVSWMQGPEERKKSVWGQRLCLYGSSFLNAKEKLASKSSASLKVEPLWMDIVALPAVRAIIEGNIDSDIDPDDLVEKFLHVLPQVMKQRGLDIAEEFEQDARRRLDLHRLSKPSELPWVIFQCQTCGKRFTFEKTLSHPCLCVERQRKPTSKMSAYEKFLMEYCPDHSVLCTQVLHADITASRRAENLIRRMGKNPSRVTRGELIRSTVKVACSLCPSNTATSMGFECAFGHCLTTHIGKKETEVWSRVSARLQDPAN